ncbi:DUF4956 domain-containing protein [Streptomyces sp. HPF1205]|uniref:DUF4956 domain-containing protein n=1 Tax=Streptomyces sp. HPF1205 TaxID=2873262 RepID=UPI001CEC7544|nr:DUF4956 domain-containing protein [Streptomyces sp. HPF1205]
MDHQAVLLAASGSAGQSAVGDLISRAGVNTLTVLLLVGWLYRRRKAAPEMPMVLTALNLGLFAAMTTISAGKFPAGVGFGLFGILSLVRLRSAAFTLRDVAYTFLALVIALTGGLPERGFPMVAGIDAALLVMVLIVDDPRSHPCTRMMRVTLDRLYSRPEDIRADVIRRMAVEPLSVTVDDVDYVRETTRVTVLYAVDDPAPPAASTDDADESSPERELIA